MYLFVGMIILVILVVWVILYIASGIFEFIKGLISRKDNKNYPKRSFHQKIAMLLTPTVNVVSDDVYRQNRLLQEQMDYQNRLFQEQMNRQFMDYSMEECMKASTPLEHGGYDMTQGNSFNEPSFFGGCGFHNDFNNHMNMF